VLLQANRMAGKTSRSLRHDGIMLLQAKQSIPDRTLCCAKVHCMSCCQCSCSAAASKPHQALLLQVPSAGLVTTNATASVL
jgi:hypothetical protein